MKDHETNVALIEKLYKGKNKHYMHGVGTRDGAGNALGNIGGKGARKRLNAMMKELDKNFKDGDKRIDIVGFSRGAAMAREFANMVADKCPKAQIDFVGLFDTVGSFGIGGNKMDPGIRMRLPDNVKKVLHITAGQRGKDGERRALFPLASIKDGPNAKLRYGWKEFAVLGAHSDIGGGYKKGRRIANWTLNEMYKTMKKSGAPMTKRNRFMKYGDNRYRQHDSRWPNDKLVETLKGGPRNRKVYYYPPKK